MCELTTRVSRTSNQTGGELETRCLVRARPPTPVCLVVWKKLCSCNVKAPVPVQCHHIVELSPLSGDLALDPTLLKAIVLSDCDSHGIAIANSTTVPHGVNTKSH